MSNKSLQSNLISVYGSRLESSTQKLVSNESRVKFSHYTQPRGGDSENATVWQPLHMMFIITKGVYVQRFHRIAKNVWNVVLEYCFHVPEHFSFYIFKKIKQPSSPYEHKLGFKNMANGCCNCTRQSNGWISLPELREEGSVWLAHLHN